MCVRPMSQVRSCAQERCSSHVGYYTLFVMHAEVVATAWTARHAPARPQEVLLYRNKCVFDH